MNIKKIFSVLAAVFLIAFSGKSGVKAYDNDIDTSAAAYVLAETDTGRIVREHNSDIRVPAGALNKLMTSLIVLECMEDGMFAQDTLLTASENAHNAGGAVIWLDTGEKITVSELLRGLMIGNANDAAVVFAENIAGNCEGFTVLMNSRAAELGMKDTKFVSPFRTDDESQYTTAADASVLACELAKHEEAYEIMTTWLVYIRDGKTELANENELVKKYEGITGLKAWHTEKSGWSLAASAERNGNRFTAVVLGCSDSQDRFITGRKLLNTGFSGYRTVISGFSDEFIKPVKVKKGYENAVLVCAEKTEALVIPKGQEGSLNTVIVVPEYLEAPVKKGQHIGTAAFYLDKTLLYETPLITAENVEKNTFKRSLMNIIVKMFK